MHFVGAGRMKQFFEVGRKCRRHWVICGGVRRGIWWGIIGRRKHGRRSVSGRRR